MKNIIKRLILDMFGVKITRFDRRIVSLRSENNSIGDVLLSYVIDPFLMKKSENIPLSHQKYWESLQIATTFLELGFNVDVINYNNTSFSPKKNYNIFIGSRVNFHQIAHHLNPDCIKIAHLTIFIK